MLIVHKINYLIIKHINVVTFKVTGGLNPNGGGQRTYFAFYDKTRISTLKRQIVTSYICHHKHR